jgi:2'-5' RNA ligase
VPRASLRWVPRDNLHVTVWFLGEVREPEALVATLRAPIGIRPFTMHVAGAGLFPPTGAPRVVWLGLPAGRDGLLATYDALRPRLARHGFEPEKRPYNPHLTVARVKDISRPDAAKVRAMLGDSRDSAGGCRVEAVTLFKSRTSPHGAEYERLFRVPLE